MPEPTQPESSQPAESVADLQAECHAVWERIVALDAQRREAMADYRMAQQLLWKAERAARDTADVRVVEAKRYRAVCSRCGWESDLVLLASMAESLEQLVEDWRADAPVAKQPWPGRANEAWNAVGQAIGVRWAADKWLGAP